jgi:hypothetical protein
VFPENDFYGHKRVLSDYCLLERQKPIFGQVIHGWEYNYHFSNRKFRYIPIFLWNSRHLKSLKEESSTSGKVIGAPFTYLVRSLWPDGLYQTGSGTLVFWTHSVSVPLSFLEIRNFIKNIEETQSPPFTVSLFFEDWTLRNRQLFEEFGWRVISFGPRSRSNFLTRLALEISEHRNVVSNEIQSALLYAGILRKNIRILGQPPNWSSESSAIQNTKEKAREVYSNIRETGLTGSQAFELCANELGWNENLCPDELKEVLGWSSQLRIGMSNAIGKIIDLKAGANIRAGNLNLQFNKESFLNAGYPNQDSI